MSNLSAQEIVFGLTFDVRARLIRLGLWCQKVGSMISLRENECRRRNRFKRSCLERKCRLSLHGNLRAVSHISVLMDTAERRSVPGSIPPLCRLLFLDTQVGPLSKLPDDESHRRH